MFNWIKNLFTTQNDITSSGYHYKIYVRGQYIDSKNTIEEADQYIKELFDLSSEKHPTININESYTARFKYFKSNFKVTRYCNSCGLSGTGCGQC